MKFEINTQRTVEYNSIVIEVTSEDVADLLRYGHIMQYNEGMNRLVQNNITIKLVGNKTNE